MSSYTLIIGIKGKYSKHAVAQDLNNKSGF